MKIGIATFVNEDNYGAMLQAYAMQFFLKKNNVDIEFLNINLKDYAQENGDFFKYIFLKIFFLRKGINFNKFRKCLNISSDTIPDKNKYSNLIIGSDQVWNPLLMGNELQPIFFGDGFKCQIIGYACSCGNTRVLEDKRELIKEYLKNFNNISVREKKLELFLHDITDQNVCTVLDPVFLLCKEEWKDFFYPQKKNIKNPYIFVYLMEDSTVITNAINELSEKEHLDVVTLRTKKHYKNETKRFPEADPRLFLELLSNAEIIVTNSFHAVAFSYIFNKRVALFRHSQFNDRLDNLIGLLGLPQDVYYVDAKTEINFKEISDDTKMIEAKEASIDFLTKSLHIV